MQLSAAEPKKVLFHGTVSWSCYPGTHVIKDDPRERQISQTFQKQSQGVARTVFPTMSLSSPLHSSPWVWFSRSEHLELVFLPCSHPRNCHGVWWHRKDKLSMKRSHARSIWLLSPPEWELTFLLFMSKLFTRVPWSSSFLSPSPTPPVSALVFLHRGTVNIRLSWEAAGCVMQWLQGWRPWFKTGFCRQGALRPSPGKMRAIIHSMSSSQDSGEESSEINHVTGK